MGFDCAECDDPYGAMLELAQRRLAYRAVILSLAVLYREELSLIPTLKRRFAHVEIWLAHTDGRQAALAESMRLGADGLIDDEGLHRIAAPASPLAPSQALTDDPVATSYHPLPPASVPPESEPGEASSAEASGAPVELGPLDEPVLSADELRALLQDQPAMPPSGGTDET
jgi:hypothetical protein